MMRLLPAFTLVAALLGLLIIVVSAEGEGEGTPAVQAAASPTVTQAGPIEMGIDAETTGNTCGPSTPPADGCTLGTIEWCYELTCPSEDCTWDGSSSFDGTSDYVIDVYVDDPAGSAPAPILYDAYVHYDQTKVHIAAPGTDGKIKMPGADFQSGAEAALPDSDGTFNGGWMFLIAVPTPGVNTYIGDGPLLRLGLDIGASGLAYFSFLETASNYNSIAPGGWPNYWSHPLTFKNGMLAINQDCPLVPPTPSPTLTPGTPTPGTPTPTPTLAPGTPTPTPTLAPGTPTPTPTPAPGTPTPTPAPGTVMLVSGWNDVCYVGPPRPIEDALTDISDRVQAVYRLSAGQGSQRWFPGRPELSTITTVGSYEALLILVLDSATWSQQPAGVPPSALPLVQGWNNVCYTGQTKSAEDATAGVAGGFGIMYQLSSDQDWSRFVPARPEVSNIAQVSQYDTVLMLVNQEGGTTWTFDP